MSNPHRLEWLRTGRCTSCGERDEDSRAAGFRMCAECRSVNRAKRGSTAEAHRRRRQRADVTGLCRRCTTRPRAEGHTRCEVCVEQVRVLQRDRRDRLAAAGLCTECRQAPRSGGRRCVGCAKRNRDRVNASRQRQEAA